MIDVTHVDIYVLVALYATRVIILDVKESIRRFKRRFSGFSGPTGDNGKDVYGCYGHAKSG